MYSGPTLSQLRRQVDALKRKYAKELAVYRLRRVASEICLLWDIATAKRQPKPDPFACIRRVADAGFRLNTWMPFHNYIQRCRDNNRHPEVRDIVTTLLPWAAEAGYINFLRWDAPAAA